MSLLKALGIDRTSSDYDYGKLTADWQAVSQRLFTHPLEAARPHVTSTCLSFTFFPLYIALRNEVTPVTPHVIRRLIELYPTALKEETIFMALRNPQTSSEVMKALLEAKLTFATTKYLWYATTLHYAAMRGTSLPAVKALIDANPSNLGVKDHDERLPLHAACSEGEPEILKLLIQEGVKHGVGGNHEYACGGLFEQDRSGDTPLNCAMKRMIFLQDCHSYNSHTNKQKNVSPNIKKSLSRYYNSTAFRTKCSNSWRGLTFCVQATAWEDAKGQTNGISSCESDSFLRAAINLAVQSIPDHNSYTLNEFSLDSNVLFHLLLHTGHCNKQRIASTPIDHLGRLPFRIAYEKGLRKDTGLCQILRAYPEAIFALDINLELMPYLMSTFGKEFGLNSLFSLLKGIPPILNREQNCLHSPNRKDHVSSNIKRSNIQRETIDKGVEQGKSKKLKQ